MTTEQLIRALPKVVLHDHLDGGLRPGTVVELAAAIGHELPTTNPEELGRWFEAAADSGSLVRYLETFEHTVAVMQTREGLERVAREAVADLVAEGVVYAELRWAPEQHLTGGLSLQETVDAVAQGIAQGVTAAQEAGKRIEVGQLLTAMRHADRWDEIARLALANRDRGVYGFDIAGAEDGFLPNRFPEVWQLLNEHAFPVTIHAGEAAGLDSIAQAVQVGRALRIGHGVRIIEDIEGFGGDTPRLGRVANWVRDNQITLEVCPCSNLQTGAATSIANHPITGLRDLDFAVSINTDNRLMSATSMTREMTRLVNEAGWSLDDLLDATLTAVWSAFIHHDSRHELGEYVIAEHARLRDTLTTAPTMNGENS